MSAQLPAYLYRTTYILHTSHIHMHIPPFNVHVHSDENSLDYYLLVYIGDVCILHIRPTQRYYREGSSWAFEGHPAYSNPDFLSHHIITTYRYKLCRPVGDTTLVSKLSSHLLIRHRAMQFAARQWRFTIACRGHCILYIYVGSRLGAASSYNIVTYCTYLGRHLGKME